MTPFWPLIGVVAAVGFNEVALSATDVMLWPLPVLLVLTVFGIPVPFTPDLLIAEPHVFEELGVELPPDVVDAERCCPVKLLVSSPPAGTYALMLSDRGLPATTSSAFAFSRSGGLLLVAVDTAVLPEV